MNQYIDHTLLKPDSTQENIRKLCNEAEKYKFASVCVHPHYVSFAHQCLKHTKVKICTVIGFPLGQNTTITKVFEAKNAIENGADEIDMVINVSWLKDKTYEKLKDEIYSLKNAIGQHVLKVIIEISLLNKEDIVQISQIISDSGADFIKTSTGFGAHGATFEAVEIMKANISKNVQIKASGGIRDYETAQRYIELGVGRLGTSSGIEIIQGKTSDKNY